MNENMHIGISETRMKHILGVARKCYALAKAEGFDEEKCRRMFMLGYLHDVGYEFADSRSEHAVVSVNLIDSIGTIDRECIMSILHHGSMVEITEQSDEWRILVTADMSVDYNGEDIEVSARLAGIRKHYGDNSRQYINSYNVCKYLGLLEENK